MRILLGLTAALLGTVVSLSNVTKASAGDDPSWQACIGTATAPADRVAACNAVIEGKTETGPRLAAAYCNRGHGLTERHELDAALADLNEAIRLNSTFTCAYTNRGRAYAFKRDFDHAIADYDEAIRIDPTFALAYNNRGDAWLNKGDLDRAKADFDLAIKYNPKLAIAYGNRGFVYYRRHDAAHAIADYTMQIKLAPGLIAYIDRGNVYRDTEQLDRAAADDGEAAKIAPTDARGWRNRGLIRLFQGDNKGGIADYDKALQYDPADADSWNNRGQAKMRLGDKTGAAADLRKALELQPDMRIAQETLARLGATR